MTKMQAYIAKLRESYSKPFIADTPYSKGIRDAEVKYNLACVDLFDALFGSMPDEVFDFIVGKGGLLK